MNEKYTKNKFKYFYKELIKASVEEYFSKSLLDKENIKDFINKQMSFLSFNEKDLLNIREELYKEFLEAKYYLFINETEKIINIIMRNDENVKIDYKFNDTDPAIYYHKNNSFYLINYDSVEKKWYLSAIEENTLNLIEEIYSNEYDLFVEYLQNKSH